MNRRDLSVLVIAAGLASGGLLAGSLARAQGDAPAGRAPAPSAWEYRVFPMDYSEYSEKDDWKEKLERAGGNAIKADADFKSYVLNWLAREGWELVQVVQTKEKLTFFYLRRPRTGDAPQDQGEPLPRDPKELPPDGQRPRRGAR